MKLYIMQFSPISYYFQPYQGLISTVAEPSLPSFLNLSLSLSLTHARTHTLSLSLCLYFNSPVFRKQEGEQNFEAVVGITPN
jgi:hypothetical protein